MRIRTYRPVDMPLLLEIQQLAAQTDGTTRASPTDFAVWLSNPALEATHNVFIVTDDDETNTWGQGDTLEGIVTKSDLLEFWAHNRSGK